MDTNTEQEIQDLQAEISSLRGDLEALTQEYYRNNFNAQQDFTKYSNFTTRLRVPHFATLPTVGNVGELFEYGGKLYIVSASNVNTIVGTQS